MTTMTTVTEPTGLHRYLVESKPVARGGFAWSVLEEQAGGRKVVLANGVMFPEPGQGLDHDSLVSFVQTVESRRLAH